MRILGSLRSSAVVLLGLGMALAVSLASCGPTPGDGEGAADGATKAEMEAVLVPYLEALSTAYATGNVEALRPHAVERVMAQVEKRVVDLANEGMLLDPEFEGLVVEEIEEWGNDFALVTTLETWDLRYLSTGSRAVISERLGTKSRVEYQLKVIDGSWMVFHRELAQEFDAE